MNCKFIVSTLTILLYYFSTPATCENFNPRRPVITTEGSDWTFLNHENTTIIGNMSEMQLKMICTAPFPIEWSFQGFMGNKKTLRVGDAKTVITSKGEINYFLAAWEFFVIPTTVKATCACFNNSEISSAMHIIVEDNPFGRLILTQTETVGKHTLIPCLSTDPASSVELLKETGGVYQTIQNVIYERTLGFTLTQPQTGNFKCRGISNQTKEVTFLIRDPYESLPFVRDETWLTNEIVSIDCNTAGEIETNVIFHSHFEKYKTTLVNTTNSLVTYNKTVGRTTFNCTNSKGELRSVLHYSIIEAPVLRFENNNGEVQCLSTAKNKSISGIQCLNNNDCKLLENRFGNEDLQNEHHIYNKGNTGDEFCTYPKYDCVSMQNSFPYGLLECGVNDKARHGVFEFFTGLELIKYSNWRDAPDDHLVHMYTTRTHLNANESTTFYCEAVQYLFGDSFHYNLTYFNGSNVRLKENLDYENVVEDDIRQTVARFKIISGIKIILPVDAVQLTCYVFLMTEPFHIAATRNFAIEYLSQPFIDRKETSFSLTKGIKGQLSCKSSGYPAPDMKWTKTINALRKAEDLNYETKRISDEEIILQFKNPVELSDEGEYVCTSVNRIGNDTVTFTLTIAESPEVTLYAIIFGTLGVILVLAVVALYLWRQNTLAMNMLRQLTEEEIDEFIHGNREMWLLNITNKQENINCMPYNNQYEIPVQKIRYDSSSILGSGEFGMVVTAKLDDKTVAVKSTKPAADVMYFKALLSELKIMMFIGHHENIVKFIGANTANIKNRKIYIVFELCPLGSLEAYLRESRFSGPGEAKLINYESSRRLVSIDSLLYWSHQLACAMEYLAKKSVVHADLATRNVLLNENQVVKLADFGLSLKLYTDNNYAKKQQTILPFRWMAIESLKMLKFSTESDIWSYGVTIWEIFSFGEVPYPQESWNNIFVEKLCGGMRLQKPKCCPENIYEFCMMRCWNPLAKNRPTFSFLADFFLQQINNRKCDALPGTEEISTNSMHSQRRSESPRRVTRYTNISVYDSASGTYVNAT